MDEIKRKLELIDKQLARRRFHTRVVGTCPLAFVAVGLCAGVILQSNLGAPVSIWFALLALSAIAAVLFFAIEQLYGLESQYGTAYLALTCFACLGAIRLTDYGSPAPNDIRNCVGDQRTLATIRGRIATDPYINRYPDWKFARFRYVDPTSSFYLKIDRVETTEGWASAQGMIRVQVDEPVLDLKAGNKIQAYCWLDRFGPPTNPGQFDSAAYLARRNVFISASVKSRAAIKILASLPAGTLASLRAKAGQVAATALSGDMDRQDAERGLLQALLLGERRKISRDTYLAFHKTGLLHFISLSGMHMGILIGIIWRASKIAGLMKPARAAICAIAVVLFLLVVPPRAPTVRAAVICWVFCASILCRRHSNPVNTLSLAAVILLLIRPTQLFEAGWQLSFASVLGIILFTERIERLIFGESEQLRQRQGFSRVVTAIRLLFAVGLAAWLGGAGILLYHFHTINPFTSIWTVLAFPLVSAILILGFLKMILFFLLPTLSGLLGFATAILSSLLIWIVGLIGNLDISQILIGRVSAVPVLGYYFLVVAAGYVHFRRPLIKRLICTVMSLSLIVYVGALKYQRTHPENLVVTCLDVGHGQAIMAQLPGGTNILFDAGSLHNSNIGARVAAPFLNYKGTNKIDAILISHNDTDHINGIPEIVETCNVGGVYANDAFFDKLDRWGTAAFLRECLAERGFKIELLKGDIHSNNSVINTLWPVEELPDANGLTDNNRSLVSLIEFAGVRILLCSDIEQFAQAELLRRHPNLEADVTVVPHHGSARTLDAAFLESLNAKVLIFSCDRRQYQRTITGMGPTCETSNKGKSLYTAKDGAISVTVRKDGTIETAAFLK
ncbi:MAG: DNA internalization-related competence protein ComEC/Rec2 [Phycisphaerales bacterium]|nr:MAG: DNA internalization-related competence protein ComEC/Rec2 [Phycisphaerales bacterium]